MGGGSWVRGGMVRPPVARPGRAPDKIRRGAYQEGPTAYRQPGQTKRRRGRGEARRRPGRRWLEPGRTTSLERLKIPPGPWPRGSAPVRRYFFPCEPSKTGAGRTGEHLGPATRRNRGREVRQLSAGSGTRGRARNGGICRRICRGRVGRREAPCSLFVRRARTGAGRGVPARTNVTGRRRPQRAW